MSVDKTLFLLKKKKKTFADRIVAKFGSSVVGIWTQEEIEGNLMYDKGPNHINGSFSNVGRGQSPLGDGGKFSAYYNGTTGCTNIYSAGLVSAFNGSELSIVCWAKTNWNTASFRTMINIQANANNYVRIHGGPTAAYIRYDYMSGAVDCVRDMTGITDSLAHCFGITISKTNGRMRPYFDGSQYLDDNAVTGTWSGTPYIDNSAIGSTWGTYGGANWFAGYIGLTAVFNRELTPYEMAWLSSPQPSVGILFIGDSKTNGDPGFRRPLLTSLSSQTAKHWTEVPRRIAISGIDTATMVGRCDADIAGYAGIDPPSDIIINLGANDVNGSTLAANWNVNTRYLINAYHTAYPGANIRLTKIWKRSCAVAIASANALIDTMYGDYSWLKPGINETTFLEGGNDGATYTSDGVHPNTAGYALEATAWKTVMGY